jgi:hypothetical protein
MDVEIRKQRVSGLMSPASASDFDRIISMIFSSSSSLMLGSLPLGCGPYGIRKSLRAKTCSPCELSASRAPSSSAIGSQTGRCNIFKGLYRTLKR